MKRTILTIVLLLSIHLYTQEEETAVNTSYYVVGRFFITQTSQGYQAQADGYVSRHHRTMYKSIEEVMNVKPLK